MWQLNSHSQLVDDRLAPLSQRQSATALYQVTPITGWVGVLWIISAENQPLESSNSYSCQSPAKGKEHALL
jgi:hypothetical protein